MSNGLQITTYKQRATKTTYEGQPTKTTSLMHSPFKSQVPATCVSFRLYALHHAHSLLWAQGDQPHRTGQSPSFPSPSLSMDSGSHPLLHSACRSPQTCADHPVSRSDKFFL